MKNQVTKEPFNTAADKLARRPMVIDQVTGDMLAQGVYAVGWMSHIVIAPPLIITEEEIDIAVAALDRSLSIADNAL